LGFSPGPTLQEWTRDIEEKVKGFLGETSKALKIPAEKSTDSKRPPGERVQAPPAEKL